MKNIFYLLLWPLYWLIRVITKLPNTEQSSKGKGKTHKSTNRQNQSTTGKLGKPQWILKKKIISNVVHLFCWLVTHLTLVVVKFATSNTFIYTALWNYYITNVLLWFCVACLITKIICFLSTFKPCCCQICYWNTQPLQSTQYCKDVIQ